MTNDSTNSTSGGASSSGASTPDDVSQLLVPPKSTRDKEIDLKSEAPPVVVVRPEELILVAEDSKTNSAIISLNLRNLGFDVEEFKDGLSAINSVKAMDAKQLGRVKAIFSDYMMPGADGFEFLTFIRQHPQLGRAPFVICSAMGDKKVIQQALSLSATSYILKPVTFDKLRKVIVAIFKDREFPTQEEIAARKQPARKA